MVKIFLNQLQNEVRLCERAHEHVLLRVSVVVQKSVPEPNLHGRIPSA